MNVDRSGLRIWVFHHAADFVHLRIPDAWSGPKFLDTVLGGIDLAAGITPGV